MRVHLNDSWDFEPELSYAGKGAKSTFTVVTPGFTVTSTARENYVEVPLLLKVFTGPPSAVRAYAEGGPALAFLASCSVSESAPGVSQGCNTQVSTFNSFDTGILVGAGLELPMGSTAILLGARYNLGLLSATTDGSSLKNRNLQFLTGIRF